MAATHTLDQTDIDYVCRLILEAGALAPQKRAGIEIVEKTGPHDRVTTADLELSRIIVDSLGKRFTQDKIISEEDTIHDTAPNQRVWLVDPIDGTDNYIANDGQYSVMIGLLINSQPVFGWVYAPATETTYFGGPQYGSWRQRDSTSPSRFEISRPLQTQEQVRLMLGWRDRKNYPWIKDLPYVTLVKTGSIGLKVTKILDDQADLFVYLSGKLKTWDTAGPIAIALGGGLEVGTMESQGISYPEDSFVHKTSVIIGRPGSVNWCRTHLGNTVGTK